MKIETISSQNLKPLTELTLALCRDCNFEEELKNWFKVMTKGNEIVYLAKSDLDYIGFIHISIRQDYVEGSLHEKTAYLEAIYVLDDFRNLGVANQLIKKGEEWAKSNGLKQIASDTAINNFSSIEFHKKKWLSGSQ